MVLGRRKVRLNQCWEKMAAKSTTIAAASRTMVVLRWRRSEPGTPHPRKRIEAIAKLNRAGIPCGVMVAPVLPRLSDDPRMLMDVVRAAVDAGAAHITPILLHLRPVVREEYLAWLRDAYPDLVTTYEELYAGSAYGPKAMRDALGRRVDGLVRAAGGLRPTARRGRADPAPDRPRVRQLQLL